MSLSLNSNYMAHVKTTDGMEVKVPSQGQVTYNSVAGSAGLAAKSRRRANITVGLCMFL